MVRSHHTRGAQMCWYVYIGFIQPCSTIEWNKVEETSAESKLPSHLPPQKKSSGRKHTKTGLKSPNFYGKVQYKNQTSYRIYSAFMSIEFNWCISDRCVVISLVSWRVGPNCCMALSSAWKSFSTLRSNPATAFSKSWTSYLCGFLGSGGRGKNVENNWIGNIYLIICI